MLVWNAQSFSQSSYSSSVFGVRALHNKCGSHYWAALALRVVLGQPAKPKDLYQMKGENSTVKIAREKIVVVRVGELCGMCLALITLADVYNFIWIFGQS